VKDWQLGQRVLIEGRIIGLLLTTKNNKEIAFLTVEIDDPEAPKAFPRLSITSESPAMQPKGGPG
jgi:hypothetical protein